MRRVFKLFGSLPGFLLGVASVLDLGATSSNCTSRKGASDADYSALASDWQKTGEDLTKGIETYEREYGY